VHADKTASPMSGRHALDFVDRGSDIVVVIVTPESSRRQRHRIALQGFAGAPRPAAERGCKSLQRASPGSPNGARDGPFVQTPREDRVYVRAGTPAAKRGGTRDRPGNTTEEDP